MQPIEASRKFQIWKSQLEKNGVTIRAVNELHSVRKKNGEILFSLINVQANDPEGTPLLPVVMLRGHFVSVLTWIVNRETKERKLLLVKQRRVANGAIFYEHPAGMMDEDADPFLVACKEVEEETGVVIKPEQLRLLWPEVLYSSPGLLDEGGWFFECVLEMSEHEILALDHANAGHGGEGEFIKTCVLTEIEAIPLMNNTQTLLAMALSKRL